MPARKPTPRPGQPVRGSKSGQPLMALFDLLGRRWAITVLWSLRHSPLNFRELQAAAEGIATSVLNTRLRELREAALVVTGDDGYELTELGASLLAAGQPLVAWADAWAEERP
ncbi:helix-turn-helix domain-containing protein [Paraconexibacter sp. AEG42_29]|uniref:winged helix-turn-helix transcriptional regulator n=1 Tax=Paraconexibacter sp. AEG42_29 TaxID=2997339 RepID=UPI00339D95F6